MSPEYRAAKERLAEAINDMLVQLDIEEGVPEDTAGAVLTHWVVVADRYAMRADGEDGSQVSRVNSPMPDWQIKGLLIEGVDGLRGLDAFDVRGDEP